MGTSKSLKRAEIVVKSSENDVASIQSIVYEFGGFVLGRNELRRLDRSPVPLTPRLLDTLRYLVERNDRLLRKEEIMDAVWADSIVEENNLAQAISKLRQILGEKPGADFIATVPRYGYRFVAPVRVFEPMDSGPRGSEAPVFSQTTAASPRGRVVAIAIALLLITAVALWWWQRANPTSRTDAAAQLEKSIAVLPFDNLSLDKGDAFFADGIQDDILTSLGKIKGLKVIARASTLDYPGTPSAKRLREIARAVGASHVLEGSVRRVADRVVVSVALIDTRNQRQVWAERYAGTLADTLSLQGELAVDIARELRANLSPPENTAAAIRPTQDTEAYVFYLRGRDAETGAQKSLSHSEALQFYQQAVERDPRFALARARLSICASYLFAERGEARRKTQARVEAEDALRLQPQLGEAHLALAFSELWGDNDDDRALAEVNWAAELSPNSAEVPLVAAYIHKRHDRLAERVAALARAESLDPRNRMVLSLTHLAHRWMRNWPEAIRALDRRSLAWPDERYPNYSIAWDRAQDGFYLTGDISVLERALAKEASANAAENQALLRFASYSTAMRKRDYAAAAQHLAGLSQADLDRSDFGGPKSFHHALLLFASNGDPAEIRQAFIAARNDCQSHLPPASAQGAAKGFGLLAQPSDARAIAIARISLALLDAFAGEKQEAIAAATDAINLSRTSPGSLEPNQLRGALALIYARLGETDRAVDLLEALIKLPAELPDEAFLYNVTLADLKLGWQWDPLRNNRRFQSLLIQSEAAAGP